MRILGKRASCYSTEQLERMIIYKTDPEGNLLSDGQLMEVIKTRRIRTKGGKLNELQRRLPVTSGRFNLP